MDSASTSRRRDAHQLRWEEGQDIFSRYLPWAMVFGVADRWSRIFEQLAAEGRYTYAPTWYVGSTHGFGNFSEIGSSMDRLTSSGMGDLTYTPGSSGGSGSFGGGGGFSGGGGGGGGAGGR